MIIQVQMNEQSLRDALNKLGYVTEVIEVPVWRKAYHNRDELTIVSRLHVVEAGVKKPAKEFFEQLLDKSIINFIKNNK